MPQADVAHTTPEVETCKLVSHRPATAGAAYRVKARSTFTSKCRQFDWPTPIPRNLNKHETGIQQIKKYMHLPCQLISARSKWGKNRDFFSNDKNKTPCK